jgi:radical SAM superfamily enzyme YgiQ (UPF0313 family)
MPKLHKIQFIYPRFRRFYEVLAEWSPQFGTRDYNAYADSRTPPCLAFPILAAMTPREVEIDFVDDRIEEPDMNKLDADIYCLHVKTEMAPRAYELSDQLRKAGKTVVLGGLHVTYRPEEAKQHADAVCVGDAEGPWQEILADYTRGSLKQFYRRDRPVELHEVPIPRREIYDRYSYSNPCNYLQVSRGCMLTCTGCPIPFAYGKQLRLRPLKLVEEELKSFPSPTIYITDDNMFFTGERYASYTDDLLRLLARFGKPSSWASAIGLPRRYDKEFLRLAQEANVHSIYNVLYDSLSSRAINGNQEALDRFREIYDSYREAGIQIWMSIYIGSDDHDATIAEKVSLFLEKVGAELVEFVIPTPFPETPLWHKMLKENRLLHTNWDDYDGLHSVFQPKHFAPSQLESLVRELWIEFYSKHTYIFDRDDIKVLLNS